MPAHVAMAQSAASDVIRVPGIEQPEGVVSQRNRPVAHAGTSCNQETNPSPKNSSFFIIPKLKGSIEVSKQSTSKWCGFLQWSLWAAQDDTESDRQFTHFLPI